MAKKRAGDGEDWLEALYAAAPKAFVAERKRVADALKAEGRTEEARAAAHMKKPTASVWAVNQLARREPDALGDLLALGAELRSDERKVLRGGDADAFLTEARTARQKVAALARRAEGFVAEAGQKATATIARKIGQTLHAAIIADEETRARLEAGRLDDDLAPPTTFGAGGDLATTLAASLGAHDEASHKHAPENKKHAAKKHATDDKKHATDDKKHAADAKKHAADAKKHAADAKKHAADAEKHAASERKRAAAGLREQRRAQAAARKHAAVLERAAVAAERAVAARTHAVEKARAAVERAEAELRAAKDALVDAETAAAAARRAAAEAAVTRS